MSSVALTKSEATQPCGMSPMKRGARGSRPDHFRPLVPGRGPPVGHEEIEQIVGAVAPAEADEGADVAPFVGRVGLPGAPAVAALDELRPIALEGAGERVRRKCG